MTHEQGISRVPGQLVAVVAAAVILGLAALLSGPIFGPPRPTPAPTVAPATVTPDPWTALRRPLAMPPLDPDGTCPTTVDVRQTDGSALAPVPGSGPIYPFGAFDGGRLYYDSTIDRWDDLSLLWIARDGQATDALIRGRRIDAAAGSGPEIGFGDAQGPVDELTLQATRTAPLVAGWVMYRTDVTRVREPGCYGIQIDDAGGSQVIVFEARPADEAVAELLQRPFATVSPADTGCSKIEPRSTAPNAGIVGPGPAYLAWSSGPVRFAEAPSQGDWRTVISAPWVVDPRDRGPLFVRSATDNAVRFDGSDQNQPSMVGPVGTFISTPDQPPGWRTYFADISVREPGCYVLQVDLLTASYAFGAFEVVP